MNNLTKERRKEMFLALLKELEIIHGLYLSDISTRSGISINVIKNIKNDNPKRKGRPTTERILLLDDLLEEITGKRMFPGLIEEKERQLKELKDTELEELSDFQRRLKELNRDFRNLTGRILT